MIIRTLSRQISMGQYETLVQLNSMQANFFFVFIYIYIPYVPQISPFTLLEQAAPLPSMPQSQAETSRPGTPTPQSGIEANLLPEAQENVKMEQGCSKTKEESPKKQPSRYRYPKKNVESNVVNQCYTFLTTRSKSLPIVSKFLKTKQKVDLFYVLMKQGRKKQNKYMGRQVLDELIQLLDDHPIFPLYRKLGANKDIKKPQLSRAIQGAINYFLKNIIVSAILTSSKLDHDTVKEHLTRSREILAFLNRKKD